MPLRRKLWLVLDTAAGKLRVWVQDIVKLDGRQVSGYYDPNKMEIVIERGPVGPMKMTLLHELSHSSVAMYSGDVREACGFEPRYREETRVGLVEVGLYDVLARNGLLKIPPPPR